VPCYGQHDNFAGDVDRWRQFCGPDELDEAVRPRDLRVWSIDLDLAREHASPSELERDGELALLIDDTVMYEVRAELRWTGVGKRGDKAHHEGTVKTQNHQYLSATRGEGDNLRLQVDRYPTPSTARNAFIGASDESNNRTAATARKRVDLTTATRCVTERSHTHPSGSAVRVRDFSALMLMLPAR